VTKSFLWVAEILVKISTVLCEFYLKSKNIDSYEKWPVVIC